MTPAASTCPSSLRTRFIRRNSSFITIVWHARASLRRRRALSVSSCLRSYALTRLTRSASSTSVARRCDASLSFSSDALWRSLSNSPTLILRSFTGSSSGSPSGKRRLTSLRDFIMFLLASGGFASCGTKSRTAEMRSMESSPTVNSRMLTTSGPSAAPAGRQCWLVPLHSRPRLARSSSLLASAAWDVSSKCRSTQERSTSMAWTPAPPAASTAAWPAEPAVPVPAFFLYRTMTPQP
mmetsp:Transcript_10692/g.24925  ORF Transcript_10692/g.24925 Transcript_10692/m.24925 type:complete len:238 (+) Transcript_10692:597-1310(+)